MNNMKKEELEDHAKKITMFYDYINNLKEKGLQNRHEDGDYYFDDLLIEIETLNFTLYQHLGKAIINDK